MNWRLAGFFCSVSVSFADARVGDAANEDSIVKRADISPTLVPESDKKFFKKDYPFDKRPPADNLHFKHPYPVVQDSGDFDADYVKDENSDNGEFAAQTEYDRLRHKLRLEKEEAAEALDAKKRAEQRLEDLLKHHKDMERKRAAAEEARRVAEEHRRTASSVGGADSEGDSTEKADAPGGTSSSGDVEVATSQTEKAMKRLEDCKKQLQEAREKLKKLMDELEDARKREKNAEGGLDAADAKQRLAEAAHGDAQKGANEAYKEYMDAKAAYMKQQALVAKMEVDIEALAAKVRAFRRSEDADGGVYPTGADKRTEESKKGLASDHHRALYMGLGFLGVILVLLVVVSFCK